MGNALFSKDSLSKALQENKEEIKKTNQILVPAGFNIMELSSIELTKVKNKETPMFHIGVRKADDKEEKYREVSSYIVIDEQGKTTKGGVNLNLYTLLAFFANAFGLVITELDENDPLGDLETKLKTSLTKKFRGVVSHSKSLNTTFTKSFVSTDLEMRRCRALGDTSLSETTINPKDFVSELSPRDRAILDGKIIPDELAKQTKLPDANDVFGAPAVTDTPGQGVNKLPF